MELKLVFDYVLLD